MIKQLFQRAYGRLRTWRFSKREALPSQPVPSYLTHTRTLSIKKDFRKKDFSALQQSSTINFDQPDRIVYSIPRAEIVAALNRTLQHSIQDSVQDGVQDFPRHGYSSSYSTNKTNNSSNRYADHPDQVGSLADSAYLCERQGRYAEAERLYQQVILLRERRYGDQHLCVADSLSDLASLYRSQKRYSEAQPLLQRALAIRYQLMVASHLQIGDNLYQLADAFYQQLLYSKAEPLYQQALTIFRQQLGAEHPHTQAAYGDLMRLLADAIEAGKFEDLTADLPPLNLLLDFEIDPS